MLLIVVRDNRNVRGVARPTDPARLIPAYKARLLSAPGTIDLIGNLPIVDKYRQFNGTSCSLASFSHHIQLEPGQPDHLELLFDSSNQFTDCGR